MIQTKAGYKEVFPERIFSAMGNSVDISQLSEIELEDIIIHFGFQLLTQPEYKFFEKYQQQLSAPKQDADNYSQTKMKAFFEEAWGKFNPIHQQLDEDSRFLSIDTKEYSPVLYHKTNYQLAMPGTVAESILRLQRQSSYADNASEQHILNQTTTTLDQQSLIMSQQRVCVHHVNRIMPVNASKQRPRFLKALGTDGLWYFFLLKGREDLRLDERIMQLFHLLNTIFESDRMLQNLVIRRYPVIPLAPLVGLVGILNNHDTFASFVNEYRQEHNMIDIERNMIGELLGLQDLSGNKVNNEYSELTDEKRLEVFNNICSRTAARDLCDIIWLRSETTDQWFERRRNYTQSTAVMSMIGHILGLGDRHPSNLLLERGSARIVHIDFGDCFEQAMQRSQSAEYVPFRLTRMMINAMDMGGVKGVYGVTCEQTMQLLRLNKGGIMAMLEAFVLDPLAGCFKRENETEQQIDQEEYYEDEQNNNTIYISDEDEDDRWGSNKDSPPPPTYNTISKIITQQCKQNGNDGESMFGMLFGRSFGRFGVFNNEANRQTIESQAKQSISRVEQKLKGFEFGEGLMTVKTQVTKLIREAMSSENLSKMYLGW